jgi:hypothetical protein
VAWSIATAGPRALAVLLRGRQAVCNAVAIAWTLLLVVINGGHGDRILVYVWCAGRAVGLVALGNPRIARRTDQPRVVGANAPAIDRADASGGHMKPAYRGIAVAVVQCLIVLSLAGKYAIDRERLPRVWVNATPVDPDLPIRGRYVSLRLQVDVLAQATNGAPLYSERPLGCDSG